jgi:hypothetical protein
MPKKTEAERIREAIIEFERLLDDGGEEKLHQFLVQKEFFLDFLHWDGIVLSKFRLAETFVPDLVSIGFEPHSQRPRPLVTFVELECADRALFTKAGDPTSFLTHAIRQVQDWKQWVRENRAYLQSKFQKILQDYPDTARRNFRFNGRQRMIESIVHGFDDRYLVIAGRRSTLQISDRLRLGQMCEDLHNIRIVTYDSLLEGAFRLLDFHTAAYHWINISG